MILQFEGAVKRIKKLAILTSPGGKIPESWPKIGISKVGATGLKKNQVILDVKSGCSLILMGWPFDDDVIDAWHRLPEKKSEEIIELESFNNYAPNGYAKWDALGKKKYEINEVKNEKGITKFDDIVSNISGNDILMVPNGFDPVIWRSRVDGVSNVNIKDVIAHKAIPYKILPQGAGLAQLVSNGSMQFVDHSFFRIIKEVPSLPIGLNGGYSEKFVIKSGIPAPKGDYGHSCVIYEESDVPVSSSPNCR